MDAKYWFDRFDDSDDAATCLAFSFGFMAEVEQRDGPCDLKQCVQTVLYNYCKTFEEI